MMRSPRPQPDEGFSEETRSQPDSEMLYLESVDEELLNRILSQPADKRKNLAELIIRSLPNPDKEDIGRFCERLTHFDPVSYLPHELMLHILSYLAPKDLLSCAATSKSWRERSRDEKLWRSCFAREGWVVDTSKMAAYEAKRSAGLDAEKKAGRKRPVDEAFSENEALRTPSRTGTSVQGNASDVDRMEGVETSSTSLSSHRDISMDLSRPNTGISFSPNPGSLWIAPPMFRPNTKDFKLSWPYLYKQRCRLERNWEDGKYVVFQLPRADRPQDGHTECVYAIQHTTKHLVSGSRDKTIRIWDLDKYELKRRPLYGHDASVLCLQFDERPEHDIIVSGGSDAYVIVWRFSTGEIIKKMTSAHSESVLNLRFDDRYIVTCSKDKTIKIWNRNALTLNDDLVPTHALQNGDFNMDGDLIKEYSLLSTLFGHGAAVNAVIIHGNFVVSASGDRTLKAWDIKTGKQCRNYQGHQKGIACVQFDGRRIVSGSSDNSVRIFDADKQAEVACLQAHGNLVRTVQARFGDLNTVTDEELEDEAKQADDAFFKALENGMQPAAASRSGHRNAGSRRPQDMLALGTKVPPGGGGNRWSRIVSGSYDESIIVWKKDRDGIWVDKYRLSQAHHLNQRASRMRQHNPANLNNIHPTVAAQLPLAAQQHSAQDAAGGTSIALQSPSNNHLFTATADESGNVHVQHTHLTSANQASSHGASLQQGQPSQNISHPSAGNAAQAPASTNNGHPQGPPPAQAQPGANGPAVGQQHQAQQPPAANNANNAANGQPAPAHHMHPPRPESNRVFKLQFDTRRIISCSQNRVIVGWDFANGDKDLENIGTWSVETA